MKQRDQAYDAFVQQLLDGRLAPGSFVTQRELVALTGLPLGAVREMIPRLEADGLISTLPQRGLQVAAVDLRLVHEAFQLREIIETAAVAHFARTAPAALVASLRAAHARISAEAAEGVTEALIAEAQATDWGFHDAVVAHLGNGLVSEIHRVNLIRIRVIMQSRVALSPEVLPPAFAEHAAILTAVEARDADAAAAALRRHLETSRRRALGLDTGREADRHEAPDSLESSGREPPSSLESNGREPPSSLESNGREPPSPPHSNGREAPSRRTA
ncbi:GntR family transcriptional regulator [Methylobacterium sp. SyP6R]|uniref:GntR family transcriptional regulator n=1 Tax=Methylobacterium sp. SyP6R TaxID=2718876 RepID=UPI001F437460|nr:GntR family transcriptional regulator [Methylobacterium sp. SyP6R]MCF4129721.1 GntR family transcriptional regulator [Methylobacterium sp. SyP6R]